MTRRTLWMSGWLTLLLGALALSAARAESPPHLTGSTVDQSAAAAPLQTAVLAGGCFWGVQGVFEHVRGVRSAIAGYAGGEQSTAHYHMVSTGTTGHAESVAISFDPRQISYREILQIFFSVAHDPTQLNRQGPDIGPQYRSSIFYVDDSQAAIAQAYIAQLRQERVFDRPIVTRVDPLKGFFRAEDSLQDFLLKYPHSPYIVENDLPKISALQRLFPEYYRAEPIRTADIDP